MGVYDYEDLRRHIGHKIVCVCYGKKGKAPDNVAIECEDCYEVLLDFDNPEVIDKIVEKIKAKENK